MRSKLVLLACGHEWHVRDEQGRTILVMSSRDAAAWWLDDRGYVHTDNLAGESRGEVWVKGAGIK